MKQQNFSPPRGYLPEAHVAHRDSLTLGVDFLLSHQVGGAAIF